MRMRMRRTRSICRRGRSSIGGLAGTGSVGMFHETYLMSAGQYETVYANMPGWGWARWGMVPAVGRMQSAKERMKASGEK